MLSMLNFLGFKTEFVMLYMLFFFFFFFLSLGLKTQFGYYCMHEKHAEFSELPCMTNMQNVLGV